MAGPLPNKVSTSAIKSRILNIAQTSVYRVRLQPPAPVQDFLRDAPIDQQINYVDEGFNIEMLCSDATLPGQSLFTADQQIDYPGVREQMAYRKIYDDRVDFTFMVDKNYNVMQFFEGWINYITGQGTTFSNDDYRSRSSYYRMNYPNKYKTDNLYITKFEKDVAGKYLEYQFIGAFPISIAPISVSYEASNILRYTASFSFMRYVRSRKDVPSDDVSILPITGDIPVVFRPLSV